MPNKLTDRRQRLLRFIIDEYVSTAQPVGSNALVEKYGLPVSAATIRNEMAALEDEGYIAQPHTSAGRVPTDLGYRYYVEALMREERVPDDLRQMIRHQFHQAARELEEWARLSAAILAGRLQNAAIVTTPRSPEPRLRWLELVSVHDYLALLVVVLEEARVVVTDMVHRYQQLERFVASGAEGKAVVSIACGQQAANGFASVI